MLFGIPLQQQWSYGNTGSFAPTYYLQTDAPLYYYSFVDAAIAMAYKSLTPKTTIIWAHIGLGRIIHPAKDQLAMIDRALSESGCQKRLCGPLVG